MRKRLARLFCISVFLLLTSGGLCAQSLIIDSANFNTGPYGAGGSITVPIKLSGCLGPGTTFSLYLSDATGSFSGGGTLIGGYNLFFTPFVNGTLPSPVAAGSYKLRVIASSGEYATTSSFKISGNSVAISNLNDAYTNVFAGNDSTFGICPGNNPPDSVTFAFQDPQGKVNDIIILDSTGKKQNFQNVSGTFVFTGAIYNYYTIQAHIKNATGIVSARSFLVILSSVNAGIQTSGKIEICRPATVSFSLNYNSSGGIQYNYPSTLYSVGWGDGVNDATSQCQLIGQKGKLSHAYDTTSCGQPDIDTIHNAFSVTISASNQFCPTSFSQANSIVKVFENPTAIIQGFAANCYNDTITLCGTASLPGEAAPGNAPSCDNPSLKYSWYINQTSFPNSKDSCYSPPNFKIGSNYVKLVVNNGVCQDDTTIKFCLDPKPKPSFQLNGSGSASGCSPLTVKTTNLSNANNCSNTVYHWFVTDSANAYPQEGVDYTVSPNDSAFQPVFKFITPDKYYVHLYFQNSCTGPYIYDTVEVVNITGTASVTLPTTKTYCGLKTINFATDLNHKPTYNSNQGNEKYYWSVTGGSFTYVGGATPNSEYPQIQFNSFGSYIVKDSFVNNCGVTAAQQQIIFSQGDSVRASAGKSDTSVCFATTQLQLNGVEVGPADSTKWFTGGTGTFSNIKVLSPAYTFSGADKTNGAVNLILTAYPKQPTACPVVSDTLHVIIYPNNTDVDTSEIICSNSPFQYQPHSTIDTSMYNWKSSVTSGTVTGNSASGSGVIHDVLVNTSNSVNGVVNYVISPLANGCAGQTYNLTVTVNATPVLKTVLPKDTVCSGSDINLKVTGSVTGLGTSYVSLPQDSVLGNTSNTNIVHQDTIYIHDVLVNTSTTNQVVTYIITPYGIVPNECPGKADTIKIVVKPGASAAMAGNDTLLCNQSSVILNGNAPVVGTGTWKQVTNFPVTIVSPHAPNTSVTGLQPNTQYLFLWQIVGSGACGSSSSTVKITNRPTVTKADAGKDSVICTYAEGAQVTINLNANADTSRHFETGAWSIVAQPTGNTASFSNVNSPTSQFTISQSGLYSLQWTINNDAGCSPSMDTVLYSIFATPTASRPFTADTNACSGNNVTVSLPQYTGVVEKWQFKQQPYASNAWQDVANTTPTVTFPNVQDTFLVRAVLVSAGAVNGCNAVLQSDSLQINVAPPVKAGKTSGGDTVCGGGNSGTITLSGNVGTIIKWQYSTDNGASWVDTANNSNKQPYANLTTTTWFRAVVHSGLCFSAYSDTAVVAISGFATKAYAGGNDSLCGVTTALLTANTPTADEVGLWRQVSGAATTLSSTSSPSLTVSGLQNGKYGFEWSINNHICPISRDTAYLLIYPTVTKANAGKDSVICTYAEGAQVTINLNANADTSRHFETGTWSILAQPTGNTASFSNVNSPTSQFIINQSGLYSLQWTINNDAGCSPSMDTVLYSIFATPTASKPFTADTNACSGNNVTVSLPQYTGVVEKWQIKQQPYASNAWQDVANTTPTVTFPNVQDTFLVRAVLVSAGAANGCNAVLQSDSLQINVAPPVNAGKTSGGDTVCGGGNSGTITLSGNVGTIIKWQYSTDNGASWVDTANTTNKQPYANLTTITWFRAVVRSGLCFNAYSDTAVVAISGFATKASAGGNDSLCGASTALLTANSPAANEVGLWKQVLGGATTLSSTGAPSLTVNGLQNGKYGFEWSINNHICPISKDTAYIFIYPALTDSIADTSITVCKGVSVTINGMLPTGSTGTYTYEWQQSVDGGTTWTNIANGALQNLTFTPDTTVLVRRFVSGGPCSSNGNTVPVTVQASISENTIQQSQSVCINTAPALIVGSQPAGANGNFKYQWQQSTDGGTTWNDITGETNKDYQPGKLTAGVQYRRIVSTQLCSGLQASASAPVTITVNNNAKAVFSYVKDTGCAPFLIDAANITATDFSDRNGTYQWFANNNLIGQGLAFPSYTITNNNDSVQIKLLAISQFGCLSDSAEQTFYTFEKPIPSFTLSDTVGCGPLTVNFINTTPDKQKFQFNWDFGNGTTSQATDSVSATFQPSPSYTDTTYKITLSAVNVCNTISFEKDITVSSKPKASFTPDSSFNCSPRSVVFTNNSLGNNVSYSWDFGDGSPMEANNSHTVTHTYHSKDSIVYTVKLVAQNNCGADSTTFNISVNPNTIDLHFSEDVEQKFDCTNKAVTFINNTKGATIFNWNFGDSASGSNNTLVTESGVGTVTHVYGKPGTYIITLCAGNGCTQDTCTTQTIQVKQTPTAKFAAPVAVCTGDVVNFTNESQPADGSLSYVWYFGDGSVDSTDVNPQHAYLVSGKDTVVLVASANFPLGLGCRDTVSKVIAVDGPTGTLKNDTSACIGSPITLQAVSSNTEKYVFDFGDGLHSDTTANPVITHIYKLPGVYIPHVTLIAGGCYNLITSTDTIRVDSIQAAFLLDSLPVCDTTTVKLTDNSYAYFGIQAYEWVVNGNTYNGNTAMQAFTQTGTYDVRLKVTGNSGCTSSTQSQLYVYVHQTPAGSIAVSADTCARDSVYFSASVFSNDPIEYLWNFGNGAKGSGKNAATVFNPPGNYTVTVTAVTNFGCSVTLNRPVVINATPDLSITPIDTVRLCRGDTLQLNATGNNIVAWGWGPVDGLSCTTCSNPLTYPTTTTLYTVTGTNGFGCTGVDSITVNVIQPITVSAAPGSVSICLPDSLHAIQFFASGAYSYTWSPSNWLDNPNIFNPVVTIPQDSLETSTQVTYTVTGYDQYHCSSNTASVVLSIGLTPIIDLGVGDTGVAGRTIVYQPKLEKNGPFKSFTWSVLSGYGSANCLNGVCDSVQLTINGDVTFQVTAENIYGCTTTDTIHYSAFCNQNEQVFIPTGFSPDGDGINDVFMVQGKGIIVEQFKVFNRWGQVVFDGGSNFAPNLPAYGWNGTLNGTPVTEDVYVYIAKVKCTASNISFFTKGNVTLIRVKK